MKKLVIGVTTSLLVSTTTHAQFSATALSSLLGAWGTNNPQYDYNQDGIVNSADLAIVIDTNDLAEIGNGFAAETAQPTTAGVPGQFGYDAKAIARWTAVPRSEFTDEFTVGVAAFHVTGIHRVAFSVNGGAWKSIFQDRLNPSNNVKEYYIRIDPSSRADGELEIRAIAYPNVGVPRVLQGNLVNNGPSQPNQLAYRDGNHGMIVITNAQQTLPSISAFISPTGDDLKGSGTAENPFLTMGRALKRFKDVQGKCDGATIYLLEGLHQITRGSYSNSVCQSHQRYVTIRPAPGLSREQVKVYGSPAGGLGAAFLKVEDVTFYSDPSKTSAAFRAGSYTSYFWGNRVHAFYEAYNADGSLAEPAHGGSFANGNGTSGSFSGVYITNSSSLNTRGNVRSAQMVINYSTVRPGDTPVPGWGLTINFSIAEPIRIGSDHFDGWHFFGTEGSPAVRENAIWSGIFARNFPKQAMMYEYFNPGTTTLNGVAIVNIDMEQNTDSVAGSWWEMNTDHLYIENVRLPDQPLRFKRPTWATMEPRLQLKNVLIKDYCGGLADYGSSQPVAGSLPYLIEPNVRVINQTYPCPM